MAAETIVIETSKRDALLKTMTALRAAAYVSEQARIEAVNERDLARSKERRAAQSAELARWILANERYYRSRVPAILTPGETVVTQIKANLSADTGEVQAMVQQMREMLEASEAQRRKVSNELVVTKGSLTGLKKLYSDQSQALAHALAQRDDLLKDNEGKDITISRLDNAVDRLEEHLERCEDRLAEAQEKAATRVTASAPGLTNRSPSPSILIVTPTASVAREIEKGIVGVPNITVRGIQCLEGARADVVIVTPLNDEQAASEMFTMHYKAKLGTSVPLRLLPGGKLIVL